MQSGAPSHSHHFRFYLVMTTLVVGGILFLLLINNNESLAGITSSVVKDTNENADAESVDGVFENNEVLGTPAKEVNVELTFDQVPTVQKDAKIENMEVQFTDAGTKIYVNGDKLELSNLEQVTLKIQRFSGKIDLSERGLSLDGKAKRLEVNGVTLTSRGDIAITFSNLRHQAFLIDAIELKTGLELPRGSGLLEAAGKLSYTLEQDEVRMDYFNGQLATGEDGINIGGVASGIHVSGALLDLSLR